MPNSKELFREFCMSSSIKGLPKLLKAENRLLRIIWFVGMLLGVAVGLYHTILIVKAYFMFKTNTHVSLDDLSKLISFPDLTICKVNPPTIVGETGNITFINYQRLVKKAVEEASEEDQDFLQSITGLFGFYRNIQINNESVSANLHKTFMYCKWLNGTRSLTCRDPEYRFLTPGYPACLTFKQGVHRSHVRTWSAVFYLEDFEPESDIKFFKYPAAQYHSGLKVFLHEAGTLPQMSSSIPVGPGRETFIQLYQMENNLLAAPYSNCHVVTGMEGSYDFNNCVYNCDQTDMLAMCGCLDPDIPKAMVETQSAYCGRLYPNDTKRTAREVRCWENSVAAVSSKCRSKCPQPCTSLFYQTQIFDVPWPHASRALAFYNTFIKNNSEVFGDRFDLYSNISQLMATDPTAAYKALRGTDLLARNFIKITMYMGGDVQLTYSEFEDVSYSALTGSLGGILNLWMGLTFVTAIELFELFIRMMSQPPSAKDGPKPDIGKANTTSTGTANITLPHPPQLAGETHI